MTDQNNNGVSTAPYVSFKTLDGTLASFSETGLPPVIDSSVLYQKSGAIQSQLRIAFRFLGLTDEEGRVLRTMQEVVEARGTRAWEHVWGTVVSDAYADIVDGLPEQGTTQQLEKRFRERGDVSGSTLTKAIRFYLSALDSAKLTYSPYYRARVKAPTKSKPANGGTEKKESNGANEKKATRRPMAKKKAAAKQGPETSDFWVLMLDKMPPFDPEWTAQAQEAYFDAIKRIADLKGTNT